MILISHRGNLSGPLKEEENKPEYIIHALNKGFDVEIDVFFVNGNFFLGHDKPKYKVKKDFLLNSKIWCHSKNIEALDNLKKIDAHYFWHQNDDVTITSKGFFWTYPGKKLTHNSICVLPEWNNEKKFDCIGICSDFITDYC